MRLCNDAKVAQAVSVPSTIFGRRPNHLRTLRLGCYVEQNPPFQKATMTTTNAPKQRNILGIIAIALAIVGFAVAIIPLLGVVGWPLLIAALVLSIIGLTRKNQKKGAAIAALVVSVVAMIAAPIIALGLFANSVNEANKTEINTNPGASSAADSESQPGSADAEVGTRENPVPLGGELSNDDWKVVINSVDFDAAEAVAQANEFNSPAADGTQYMLVNMTVNYIGDDAEGDMPASGVFVSYVTAEGVESGDLAAVYPPDELDMTATLYEGASLTGNIVRVIPAGSQDGVLSVQLGFVGKTIFVATK